MPIKKELFQQPSGNIRGIAYATRKNGDRVAHAYLFTDGTFEITLDKIKGKLNSPSEVNDIAFLLNNFATILIREDLLEVS
jgi:hypothetical protein